MKKCVAIAVIALWTFVVSVFLFVVVHPVFSAMVLVPGTSNTWTDGVNTWSGNPSCADAKMLLKPGSPAIDAGVMIQGFHCENAGPSANCVQWYGKAPDIGACEMAAAVIPIPPPVVPPLSDGWTFCAAEGGICVFTGTREVRYGANGTYFSKVLAGGTPCDNAVFGDPLYGYGKQCDYRAVLPPPPPQNAAPVVSAGADMTITLPGGVRLSGTATDDGLPNGVLTYNWSKVSGPGVVTFTAANALAAAASFSVAGTYVLNLAVSDGAVTVSDDIVVLVNAVPSTVYTYRLVLGGNATVPKVVRCKTDTCARTMQIRKSDKVIIVDLNGTSTEVQ